MSLPAYIDIPFVLPATVNIIHIRTHILSVYRQTHTCAFATFGVTEPQINVHRHRSANLSSASESIYSSMQC